MTNTEISIKERSAGSPPERNLSLDDVFELLSDFRRRQILYRLYDSEEGKLAFDDIVDHVCTLERVSLGGHVPLEYRDNVATVLHHVDLPRLDSMDVLDWDPSTGTVRYRGRYPLDEWLEQAQNAEETGDPSTVG